MDKILISLFAVLDCGAWTVESVRAWADKMIRKSAYPECWIIDLSTGKTSSECLEVVCRAMEDAGVALPEDIGEILVGLLLLRMDENEMPETEAKREILDVVDAYGVNDLDVEAVARGDLSSRRYAGMRGSARWVLMLLNPEATGAFTNSERSGR